VTGSATGLTQRRSEAAAQKGKRNLPKDRLPQELDRAPPRERRYSRLLNRNLSSPFCAAA
jgi:hypothetical protein